MKTVFVLQHSYELNECGCDETKLIGVYFSLAEAENTIQRLNLQSGFRDRKDDFSISEYELNKDHWIEGFVTVR